VKHPKRLAGRKKGSAGAVASPSIPWEEYNQYIIRKLDSSSLDAGIETEVVISFMADSIGRLTEFQVEKPAPTNRLNEFLLDIIKTGPIWQVHGGRSARGVVRIQLGGD
jgi:outer membrane biosynthesis protein TonB